MAALTLPSVGVTTSEAFVQKLKGAADPVPVQGSSDAESIRKIDLARIALDQSTQRLQEAQHVHIPRLENVVLGWILDTLCNAAKVSSKASSVPASSPLRSEAYFLLLQRLLEKLRLPLTPASINSLSPRSTPQSYLFILSALVQLEPESRRICLPAAAEPVSQLLRPIVPTLSSSQTSRVTMDGFLGQAFQAVCALGDDDGKVAEALGMLLSVVGDAWIEAGADNPSLEVKSHQHFVDKSLSHWLEAVGRLQDLLEGRGAENSASQLRPFRNLRSNLLHIGQASLFSKSALRALLLPRATAGPSAPQLAERLRSASTKALCLQALPELVTSAVRSLRRHSNELAQAARAHKRKAAPAEAEDQEEPESTESSTSLQLLLFENFIRELLEMPSSVAARSSPPEAEAAIAAKSRTNILQGVLDSGIHANVSNTAVWGVAMRSTAASVLSDLRASTSDGRSKAYVTALRLLWKLDEEVARQHLEEAFAALSQQRTRDNESSPHVRAEVQSLLSDLLASFSRSQELPFILGIFTRTLEGASLDQWSEASLFTPRTLTAAVARAVRDYVSPTQIVGILRDQADALDRLATPTSHASPGAGSKRPHQDGVHLPLAACNLLRFAHPILAAAQIPSAVAEDAWLQIERMLGVCKAQIQDAASSSKSTATDQPKSKKAKGSSKAAQQGTGFSAESYRTASAALWCCYGICAGARSMDYESGAADLQRSRAVLAALSVQWSPLFTMVNGSGSEEAREELRIEVARMLLVWTEICLEAGENLSAIASTPGSDSFWNSVAERLASAAAAADPTASEAALWEMLARRWLITLDRHSPHPRLLPTAARLLVRTVRTSSPLAPISRDVCRNAEFHELPTWRSNVVEALLEETQGPDQSQTLRALSALALLPSQYVPADSREVLTLRAIANCVATSGTSLNAEREAVRTWLIQSARSPGRFSDKVADAVRSCLPNLVSEKVAEEDGDKTSGDLLAAWLQKLITHQQIDGEQLNALIAKASKSPRHLSIVVETLIRTSSHLTKDLDVGSYDLGRLPASAAGKSLPNLTHYLKQARLTLSLARVREVEDQTRREAGAQVANQAFTTGFTDSAAQLAATDANEQWSHFLQEYLELASACAEAKVPEVGSQACLGFARLLASNRGAFDEAVLAPLEQAYNRFLARLSPDDYQSCLNALISAVEGANPAQSTGLRSYLTLLGLSLKFGPEGTLVIAQKHFTRLLTRIQALLRAGDLDVLAGSLFAIESVCNGRAMLIRPIDATLLLSILSDVLSAKSEGKALAALALSSPAITPSKILSTVVNVTGSIIRLRMDVLVPILPQLCALLVQMPPLFRKPLPNASSAQRRRLYATLPSWLDASNEASTAASQEPAPATSALEGGLGTEDARDFARLLDTLTAKTSSLHGPAHGQGNHALARKNTAISARGSKGESGTTSSLAKPFSKHAIYVILSYIHALLPSTALGSHIPTRVKATLRTGCVGLCGIVGEVERDWILGGSELLGGVGEEGAAAGAGKGVLKDLWREWERSRYKGA